jgi:hypothetical protein
MRNAALLAALALIAAACGGSADLAQTPSTVATTAAPVAQADSEQAASTTDAPVLDNAEQAGSPDPTSAPSPSFDGPPAPDFELALGDGGTFRLSDEQKPVYVVFWAEW